MSDFQQNSDNNYIEAAADMFLNWVYRSNAAGGKGDVACGQFNNNPGHWSGPAFLNKKWVGQTSNTPTSGNDDPPISGDKRHQWADNKINSIFDNHPLW